MAHFAEIDNKNKVLRVLVACNQDVANNGGEKSEQAAEHFKKISPLSENGVKWVQTSYNHNFRRKFAMIDGTYDPIKNIFIDKKEFNSWILDENNNWVPPMQKLETFTQNNLLENGVLEKDIYIWDEININWKLITRPYPSWIYKNVNNSCFYDSPVPIPFELTNITVLEKAPIWNEELQKWEK